MQITFTDPELDKFGSEILKIITGHYTANGAALSATELLMIMVEMMSSRGERLT
ncbi:hypothetical protein [Vibrio cortegadensis]|uniref:hypothetical protein n=1 Tax=Vibrio cortegadensis TaxID=1328770 RepID=UPI0021C3E497|nr:hypothetical protein [Vibrio cortegadensis]